jgi:HSP20 family protein
MFTMVRHNPFEEAVTLRDAVNQLFADSVVRSPWFQGGERGYVPSLDVSEQADAYIVEAAVPGLKAEDLNVTIENNVLSISGEIKQEHDANEQNYHHRERFYGKFQRSITLPTTVKADAIQAALNHGVLRLEIPKAEEVKPRRISVNVGEKQLTS